MNWALRRQLFYLLIVILFFAAGGFLVIYPQFNKPPTCMDGIQNGDETGVDCGGSCANACLSQVNPVSIIWARAFEIVPGRYNAVAYLVNHNKNVAAEKVNYRFRFADANGVYVGMREGSTDIPPDSDFAVFAPAIDVGNSIPVYTTFEFTATPLWLQVSQNKTDQLKVFVSNIQLINEKTSPQLSATIKNASLFTIPDVNVVAVLYDKSGNAVSVSNTYLNQLGPLETTDINFTWPEAFSNDVVREELLPIYDIFSVSLQ